MSGENHYVSKSKITRSIVENVAVRALCGEMVFCTHQGAFAVQSNEVAHELFSTCRECDEIYDLFGQREEAEDRLREIRSEIDRRFKNARQKEEVAA